MSPSPASRARVCVLAASLPPTYGGAELAALRYVERLHQRGEAPLLFAPVMNGDDPVALRPAYIRTVRVRGSESRLSGKLAAAYRLAELAAALWPRLIRERNRFDVIHAFNSGALFNLIAVPAGRVLGKPVVLETSLIGQDDPVSLRDGPDRASPAARKRRRPIVRWQLYRMADAYVSKSHALTDRFMQTGIARDKLWQIPYSVDTELYRPADEERRARLRRRLDLPSGGEAILYVGALNERKGVHWLIEAFSHLRGGHSDAQLWLVGPSKPQQADYVRDLHARVRDHGLEGAVRFVTRLVDNVHEYMQAADVHVLPSRREGLPISVLEAMASGLAVVASDIPEIAKSQIEHERHGLLVAVGDVPGLSRALGRVVGDSDLRACLGAAARTRAEREFSVQAVDARYAELYERVLGRDGPTERKGGTHE